jgi:hypothetical protein
MRDRDQSSTWFVVTRPEGYVHRRAAEAAELPGRIDQNHSATLTPNVRCQVGKGPAFSRSSCANDSSVAPEQLLDWNLHADSVTHSEDPHVHVLRGAGNSPRNYGLNGLVGGHEHAIA